MNRYTIQNEDSILKNQPRKQFETPIEFVEKELKQHPQYLYKEVVWEHNIYSELGFSNQEYQDLIQWKNSLPPSEINLERAFDKFSDYIIGRNEKEKKDVESSDLLDALSGSVGMAIDLLFFHDLQRIPELVSSSIIGLAAIAKKIRSVKNILFGER